MNDHGLRPQPPAWALAAGLPEPSNGESFIHYVKRLGFDPKPFLEGLTSQTICCAKYRLATALKKAMPDAYDAFVQALPIEPARRKELEYIASNVFGESFRRPVRRRG